METVTARELREALDLWDALDKESRKFIMELLRAIAREDKSDDKQG